MTNQPYHENSLAAKADKETKELIRLGRRDMDDHVLRMTAWGKRGCVSSPPFPRFRNPYSLST